MPTRNDRWRSSCRGAALILILAGPICAAEPKPSAATEDPQQSQIKAYIAELGAEDFATRQSAQQALEGIGLPAVPLLEAARDSQDIEIRLRAAAIIEKINALRVAEADIHVVGLYEAGSADSRVVVRIESTPRPVVLVVCAHDTVLWQVEAAPGVELVKVIASGVKPQKVVGTAAAVETYCTEGNDPPERREKAFYSYQNRGVRYVEMCERIKDLTGKELTSFQGRHDGEGQPLVIRPEKAK